MTDPMENFVARMMAKLSHGGGQDEEKETTTNEVEENEEQCTGDPFLDSILGRLRSCEVEVEREENKTPYEKDQERFMRDDYSTGDPKIDRIFNKLKLEKKVQESALKSHDRLTDSNMTMDHMFELLCEGNADAEECINELLKAGETDPRAGLCIYSRVDSRGCYGEELAKVWIASDRDVQKFITNIDNWRK